MSGKSKFQISRSLDERIKRIIGGTNEYDTEFGQSSSAYILGFQYGNVTNYVGLTADYQSHHNVLPLVGLVFFRSTPSDEDVILRLNEIKEYSNSPKGLGSFESDKNEHLFLIYNIDKSNEIERRMFDSNSGNYCPEQPKLTILEENKIYNHSAISKIRLNIRLNLKDLDQAKQALSNGSKEISIHLKGSSFSTKASSANKDLTETLYNHLEAPPEVLQAGDYLPQMTKGDKEKLVEKWRNKMKSQRSPLEFQLEHDGLSFEDDEKPLPETYCLKLQFYLHLHVNDSISKSVQLILYLLRQKVESLRPILAANSSRQLENDELKSCTFKPSTISHLVQVIYSIPQSPSKTDYDLLKTIRKELHHTFVVPLDRPQFRFSQQMMSASLATDDEISKGYLCNVHTGIVDTSSIKNGIRSVLGGTYTYHHYLQDKIQDNGWGCAYRSLQTIISWFKHQGYIYSPDVELRAPKVEGDKTQGLRQKLSSESRVPTHEEIQTVLVDVGDKQPNFIGSQKWIGSQEVCYVLNHLYNLDSKFISVSSGSELAYKARDLGQHFVEQSTPVMIGGGVLAHTIIGLDFNEKNGDTNYLILDPHYTGSEDLATITKKGWCGWKKNNFWDKSSFYNLCLPQRPVEF